ncbi:MAG: PepSY-associated TM helix domain-containing protein [Sphingomonadales bacterium]|nr:PepSY-associated TM helix domain-containing protein [Sphingomonadales bacterium]MDE2168218.1 PepSY-associated TM helix domain-containing protein [Sphingomonadales bacterium]
MAVEGGWPLLQLQFIRDNGSHVTQTIAPLPSPKRRLTRGWWLKQLHTWHYISAAVSLVGMFAFAVTGITLNHAAAIPATPRVEDRTGQLAPSLLAMIKDTPADSNAPLPAPVAHAVAGAAGLDPTGMAGEWNPEEVYVAMPRPGGDAWVSVNRDTGQIKAEVTRQGMIALLNDLHKGRNTGLPWRLFIDAFAIAVLVFTASGLFLLHFHARHRKKTWPLVGLGFGVPLIIALVFLH